MHQLFIICGVLGLGLSVMAICGTAALGLLVWLAGSEWVRRR